MIGAAKMPRQAHFPALPAAFSRHVLLGVMASLVYHCRADVDDINGAQPRAQQSTVAGQAVAERELFTSPTLAVAAARFAACVGRVQCSVFRCAGLAREFQPMIGGTEGDVQSMSMSARDDITPPTLEDWWPLLIGDDDNQTRGCGCPFSASADAIARSRRSASLIACSRSTRSSIERGRLTAQGL